MHIWYRTVSLADCWCFHVQCVSLWQVCLAYPHNLTFPSFVSPCIHSLNKAIYVVCMNARAYGLKHNVLSPYTCLKLQQEYFTLRGFSLSILAGWWEGGGEVALWWYSKCSVIPVIRTKSWSDKKSLKFQKHKPQIAFTCNLLCYHSALTLCQHGGGGGNGWGNNEGIYGKDLTVD